MLEGGGGGELYGNATGVGESWCCCCGAGVDGELLKKDNLGDGRIGVGMNDLGGGECDGCGDCEDLALRDCALANDEADLVRFFDGFPFPLPPPSPPPRRWPEEDVDVGET